MKDHSLVGRGSSAIFDRRRSVASQCSTVGCAVGRFVRWRCCCSQPSHVTNGGDRKQPIRANTSSRPRSLQITRPSAVRPAGQPSPRRHRHLARCIYPPAGRLLSAIFQAVIPGDIDPSKPRPLICRAVCCWRPPRVTGTDRRGSTLMHRLSPVNRTPTRATR